MMPHLITILIPCYNQPYLLDRCLDSIRTQTFKDYCVILVDDNSCKSYQKVFEKNKDLDISLVKNSKNLGAVPNMIYCMQFPVDTKFKMVFHEDDIMYPNLLEYEIKAMNENDVGWVGTTMSFFSQYAAIGPTVEKDSYVFGKNNVKDLVKLILGGCTLSFSSILYRSDLSYKFNFDLPNYSMMGDRQMLLEAAKKYGCVLLNYNLVAAFDHGENDKSRWKNLKPNHIFNYFVYLSGYFKRSELKQKFLKVNFTYSFVNAFNLLSDENKCNRLNFYFKAYSLNLLSLKYLLLSNKNLRKISAKIKRIIK